MNDHQPYRSETIRVPDSDALVHLASIACTPHVIVSVWEPLQQGRHSTQASGMFDNVPAADRRATWYGAVGTHGPLETELGDLAYGSSARIEYVGAHYRAQKARARDLIRRACPWIASYHYTDEADVFVPWDEVPDDVPQYPDTGEAVDVLAHDQSLRTIATGHVLRIDDAGRVVVSVDGQVDPLHVSVEAVAR